MIVKLTLIYYFYMDGKIYIHGMDVGRKVENLLRDPRVGFAVYDGGAYQIAEQPNLGGHFVEIYGSSLFHVRLNGCWKTASTITEAKNPS